MFVFVRTEHVPTVLDMGLGRVEQVYPVAVVLAVLPVIKDNVGRYLGDGMSAGETPMGYYSLVDLPSGVTELFALKGRPVFSSFDVLKKDVEERFGLNTALF